MSTPCPPRDPPPAELVALLSNPQAIEAELERRRLETDQRSLESFLCDPYGYVMWAYPWGREGTVLAHYAGPDAWQRAFLEEVGAAAKTQYNEFVVKGKAMPLRFACASGHGIGKSVLCAWLVDWLMKTRPGARGTVTANTYEQLETKTWATIQHWASMSTLRKSFLVTASTFSHQQWRSSWSCSPQSCKEQNSEAFAGQHAAESTSFYIFDEASLIPEKIWEVAEGGLTDGMPMIFSFGNPTRNVGKFFRVCFGRERDRWNSRSIDSRECAFPNHDLHDQWAKDYGVDSDFFRVRVRGLPPITGEHQFIPGELVSAAQTREAYTLNDEPLVCGVDVSGGGDAWNVCRFRRGYDARSIPPIRISGQDGRDRGVLVAKLAEVLSDRRPDRKVSAMFIDAGFGAAIVERLNALGYRGVVHEINFGGISPDTSHCANMRAYMWRHVKDWLINGCIDEKDERLQTDLGGPGFHLNTSGKLVIESKESMGKRGVASPDDGDALALTFARPVGPRVCPVDLAYWNGHRQDRSWMG